MQLFGQAHVFSKLFDAQAPRIRNIYFVKGHSMFSCISANNWVNPKLNIICLGVMDTSTRSEHREHDDFSHFGQVKSKSYYSNPKRRRIVQMNFRVSFWLKSTAKKKHTHTQHPDLFPEFPGFPRFFWQAETNWPSDSSMSSTIP